MEFEKSNLFKKLQNSMPIGLAAMGLSRKSQCDSQKKSNKRKVYPTCFKFDKVAPVGI